MFKPLMAFLIAALACSSALAQPPARKFDDPGAPPFKVLKEGENPPLDAYDNFVIGPKYVPAPERKKVEGVPEGKVEQFVIDSKETKLFNPGIARNEFGKVDPKQPEDADRRDAHHRLQAEGRRSTSPPSTRQGTEAPFMVVHDGPGQANGYKTILDNLIAPEADSADRPHLPSPTAAATPRGTSAARNTTT